MMVTEVKGNQIWTLHSTLEAKPHGHRELVELPVGQSLITIQTTSEYVEFTAQNKYFVCKKEELTMAGNFEHNWL